MQQSNVLAQMVRHVEEAGSRTGVETTGEARVHLELVLRLEGCIVQSTPSELKEVSHDIMMSLIRLLERSCSSPVRASTLRSLAAIFSADPVRATLAHGELRNALQDRSKRVSGSDGTGFLGLLEGLALLATRTTTARIGQTLSTVTEVRALLKRAAVPALRVACLRTLTCALCSLQRPRHSCHDSTGASGLGVKGADVSTAQKECDATATMLSAPKEDASVRAAALELLGSVAESGAPHLWERKAAKWHAAAQHCSKILNDCTSDVHVRKSAVHALAACVAAPWSAAAASCATAAASSSGGAIATLQKAKDTAVDVYLLRPMHKAVAAEDRETATSFSMSLAATLRIIRDVHGASGADVTAMVLHATASLSDVAQVATHGLGSPLAAGEAPLAQACKLYPLVVVIGQLPEVDVRKMLELLAQRCTALVGNSDLLPARNAPEAVVLLSAMGKALSNIGDIAGEDADKLRDIVHRLLIASPTAVSYAAAAVLGQLAAVEGGSAARLMSDYLSLVTLQTASLGSQSGSRQGATYPLLAASEGGSDSWEDAVRELQGCVLATCALMGAVSLLPLGCPSSQLQDMYNCAVRMVDAPLATADDLRCEERRLGCLMLSCLACNLPLAMLEACEHQMLHCLTADAFGDNGRQRIDVTQYKDEKHERTARLLREVLWRCAALEALHAFTVGYIATLPPRRCAAVSCMVAEALRPVLQLFAHAERGRTFQDPLQCGEPPEVAAALMHFQRALLDVYLALPYAQAFDGQNAELLALCTGPLREGASHLTAHTRRAAQQCLLAPLLNEQDASLALYLRGDDDVPAMMAYDPLLNSLSCFAGRVGGPQAPAWQLRPPSPPQSDTAPRVPMTPSPFPQPVSLSAALLFSQLRVFGRVFPLVSATRQTALVEGLCAALAAEPAANSKKGTSLPVRTPCVCVCALTGLAAVAKARRASAEQVQPLADACKELGCALIAIGAGAARAGAEVLSFAAVIGGDAAALQTVKLCSQHIARPAPANDKVQSSDPRAWALALGATHRSVGGIVLQTALADIVTVLISFAKRGGGPNAPPGSAVHALHGLNLVMSSAFGPSGWVEVVLETALECLLRPGAYEAGIQAAAAAIVTAIVEVQGPEFCPTSKTHPVAETIMAAISARDWTISDHSAAEAIATIKQRILCARSVISFAANVPKREYLPILLATLASPVQQLRHVAAASLHVLSSSHAELLVQEQCEEKLFTALDQERSMPVRALLKDTLHTMVLCGADSGEAWIHMLCSLVSGDVSWRGSADDGLPVVSPRLQNAESLLDGTDSESPRGRDSAVHDASTNLDGGMMRDSSGVLGGSGELSRGNSWGAAASRTDAKVDELQIAGMELFGIGTRSFAFTCLSNLWQLMASTFKPERCRALLASVQPVVQCAFSVVEDKSETLKTIALDVLAQVLASFSGVADPDDDAGKAMVMDVFAAPYVTALKTCLTARSAAPHIAHAAKLAGDVLVSGMLDDDSHSCEVLISRLLSFVTDFGVAAEMDRTPHAEWVVINTRVATLHALARCVLHSKPAAGRALRDMTLTCAAAADKALPLYEWMARLSFDAAVLQHESAEVRQGLRSKLLSSTSSLTVANVQAPMCGALPHALAAACLLLAAGHASGASGIDAIGGQHCAPLFHLALMQLDSRLHTEQGVAQAGVASTQSPPPSPERRDGTDQADASMCVGTDDADVLCYCLEALCALAESSALRQGDEGLCLLASVAPMVHRIAVSPAARSAPVLAAAVRLLLRASETIANCDEPGPMAQHTANGVGAASGSTRDAIADALLACVVSTAAAAAREPIACADATAHSIQAATCLMRNDHCAERALCTAVAVLSDALPHATAHDLRAADELQSAVRLLRQRPALDGTSTPPSLSSASNGKCPCSPCGPTHCVAMLSHVVQQRKLCAAALQRALALQMALCSAADAQSSKGAEQTSSQGHEAAALCLLSVEGCLRFLHQAGDTEREATDNVAAASAAVALSCMREHVRCKGDHAGSGGLDMLLMGFLSQTLPVCTSACSATQLGTRNGGLSVLQEWWKLLLVLTASTTGRLQENLCGILVTSIIDAVSPVDVKSPDKAVSAAGRNVFTSGLQRPPLAQLLPKVLPRLSDSEKARLREGLHNAGLPASMQRGGSGGMSLATPSMAPAPQIDFAAFTAC